MAQTSILQWTPLATAAVWLTVTVYQIAKDRYHTWTEGYFVALCASVTAYAAIDVVFFNIGEPSAAWIAAIASLTALSFTALFFFLYGLTLRQGMRRIHLFALLPVVLVDALVPNVILVGVTPLAGTGPPYLPVYNPVGFMVWVGFLLGYTLTALWAYYRTYREVTRYSKKLGRRMWFTLSSFFLAVVLGGATNVVLGFYSFPTVPVFSTLLIVPGILLLFVVSPTANRAFYAVLRRSRSRGYVVVAALALYHDGTLVGSLTDPSVPMADTDLVGAMADVIQNFMRTSFPGERGGFLKSIEHGGYQLILERGKFVTVVLVLEGRETDFLRRQMRDLLHDYERQNRQAFADWKGLMGDDVGTREMLGVFFQEPDEAPTRTPG